MGSSMMLNFTMFALISGVLSLVGKVLLVIAVGNDAKARGLKSRTAFMILVFFFPLVVGIIYLCVRDSAAKIVPQMCCNCHATLAPEYQQCPNCGGFLLQDYLVPNAVNLKKSAKTCLIIAIICYIAGSGLYSYSAMRFGADVLDNIIGEDNGEYDNYDEYFDDYFSDNHQDDYNNDRGGENADSDDSAGEDFYNFGKNGN